MNGSAGVIIGLVLISFSFGCGTINYRVKLFTTPPTDLNVFVNNKLVGRTGSAGTLNFAFTNGFWSNPFDGALIEVKRDTYNGYIDLICGFCDSISDYDNAHVDYFEERLNYGSSGFSV